MIIPISVISSVIVGALLRVIWGWLDSGQPFNARKFFATIIPTIIVAAMIGAGMMESSMVIEGGGLILLVITALGTGFAIDNAMKKFTEMRTTE